LSRAAVGGIATFDDLTINMIGTGYLLRANSGSLTKVDSSVFNIIGAVATQILVETAADGSGSSIPAQNIITGNSLMVYSVSRSAATIFIENAAADSWSLVSKTGGVVDGDLVPAGDMKSATFTAHAAGTARIRATKAGLNPVDSGVLTVTGPETYGFVSKWGYSGTGDGGFDHPFGIAVDDAGHIYVADTHNQRIQKFTSSGAFVTKWGGTFGSGDGEFNLPYGVAADSAGNIYVVENGNNRVQKFTSSGTFLTKWGDLGAGDRQFNAPQGIAVDSAGNVYVADSGNHRIQKFSSDGTFITKWGSQGNADGQLNSPTGVVIASSGDVYVADYNNNRIQRFSPSGVFAARWGGYGSGDGQFASPFGLAIDSAGNIYVADYGNSRAQKFTAAGTFITQWGGVGGTDGKFLYEAGIAVDSSGYVYVIDTNNSPPRVQKFQKQ